MNQTVLITGASSGIGKSAVHYFQKQGWNVAATMRNPSNATDLANLQNVKCLQLDVLDEASITQAIASAQDAFGRIDVVINNAGYAALGAFEAASPDEIQRQFATNVFGLMNVTRGILPHFREQRAGTLINISSIGGRVTFPLYSLYHSTKWAVEGFSESLQFELRSFNIKVKLVEPGAIKTDFYDRSQALLQKTGLSAYDAYQQNVIPAYQKAGATDRSDRLRYSVGDQAPLLLLMRRLLPTTWFMAFIRRAVE
jgi:NAD(P)-dependent dehydrogenase (short-subunit alcohol dehydrogenase family)